MKKDKSRHPVSSPQLAVPGQTASGKSLPQLLFFIVIGALTLIKLLGAVDPDLFWHLKNGEIALRQGILPMVDDFSFTAPGGKLAANAWLSEVLFYMIFQVGHYLALAIFHALLVTGTCVLFYLALTHPGQSQGATQPARDRFAAVPSKTGLPKGTGMLLTAGFFVVSLPFIAPRTQNFSFFFFAAFLWLARRWENGDENAPWHMAVIIPLWNNLHSGFAVGFLVLILLTLKVVWEGKKSLPQAGAPLALAGIGGMVHPNGPKALFYPVWESFLTPSEINIIREWKPVDLTDVSVAMPFLILALCLMWTGLARVERRFPWGIMALVFFVVGLFSQRLIPYFAFSGLMALGAFISTPGSGRFSGAAVPAGWVLVFGLTFHYFAPGIGTVFPWHRQDWSKNYPRESADIIGERYSGKNVFCSYDWGGYLIYRLYPSNKVSIDGRSDLYYKFIPAYEVIMRGGPRSEKLLKKIRAHLVVVPSKAPLAQWFDYAKTWKKVLSTPKESLYEKSGTSLN